MEGIHINSTNVVQAEKIDGEPIRRIELTSWDFSCLLLEPIQKGLFFPKPTPLQEKDLFANNVVEHLKKSFARVLEFFYPLCGRFGVVLNDDNTSSWFIDCSNKGAYFIHAVVENITIKDILEPMYTPKILRSFFPMNGVVNIEGDSKPFLAVQVNELVDGFFIGCTMNHSVVDGSSYWHFFNSWSEISRGFDTISRSPDFTHWFPSEIETPIRIPSSTCLRTENCEISLPLVEEQVLHFSKENIAKLKARANSEMNTTNISSLQALLAHYWRSVIRCKKINLDIDVIYYLVVDARPRLQSFIQENYFGNTVRVVPLITKADDLVNQSLGMIASRMHEVIALQTSDELIADVINWAKNPMFVKLSAFVNNFILTGSSPRFNVYGTDFGWGKPIGVRSGPAHKFSGTIMLYPGIEEGSIDIEVCLSPEILNALRNDVEFMETVAM